MLLIESRQIVERSKKQFGGLLNTGNYEEQEDIDCIARREDKDIETPIKDKNNKSAGENEISA